MLKNYGITKLMSWICSILTVKTFESSFGDVRMYLLLLWTHLFHHSNTCVVEFYKLFLCRVWLSYFSKDLLKNRSFAVILWSNYNFLALTILVFLAAPVTWNLLKLQFGRMTVLVDPILVVTVWKSDCSYVDRDSLEE